MWRNCAFGIGAERRRGAREPRIDAGDVRQDQQEGERKAGDHERDQHARVVVRKPDRTVVQMEELQELGKPSLGAEVRQHAFGDQHGAERDRHDQDRRHPALIRRLDPHLERDRQRQPDVDQRRRKREPQRGPDRRPEIVGGEEVRVVGERPALLGRERQPQSVEERVDEQQQHEQRGRRHQQQRAVEGLTCERRRSARHD